MDETRSSVRRIIKAVCILDGAYDRFSRELGIKGNLLWLLYALDDGNFHSQKQICEDWSFHKTTINTLIKQCQAEGYVTLRAIPGQKRELHIQLTDDGRRYVRQMLKSVYEAEDAALQTTLQTCPPEFIAHLEIFVEHLKETFTNYTTKEEQA